MTEQNNNDLLTIIDEIPDFKCYEANNSAGNESNKVASLNIF
jgi:hypothetical protein